VVFRSYHLRWATTEELSKIARMKETLWQWRQKMAAVPSARHSNRCMSDEQERTTVKVLGLFHWLVKIQKYINGRHSQSVRFFGEIKRVIRETGFLGMDETVGIKQ